MEKGCPSCGRMVPSESDKCPFCNYDFGQLNSMFKKYEDMKNPEIKMPKYAGFIKRTVANILDGLLLGVIFLVINTIYLYFVMPNLFNFETILEIRQFSLLEYVKMFIPMILMPFVYFLYCVFMQASKNMGTVGEKFLGIEIIDDLGSPLSLGLSFKRNLARILDGLTCGIGYLIMIFTSKKQTLSDIITKTYATNRITNEVYNTQFYAGWFTRIIAFIIDVIILRLITVGYFYLNNYLATMKVDADFIPAVNFTKMALLVLVILIVLFYFPYMESHKGATFGKMLFSIKVKDMYGEKLSFMHALGRYILFALEILLIPFALLLVFVTPRRQTLKDLMSKSVVVI